MPREDHWFKPGQSGNPAGKPRGSRNKLAEEALRVLCADFEGNGEAAIVRCREERPDIYLRIVVSLLPRQKAEHVNPFEEWSDQELADLDGWLEARRAPGDRAEA